MHNYFVLGASRLCVPRHVCQDLILIVAPAMLALVLVKAYKLTFALWPITQNTLGWHAPSIVDVVTDLFSSPLSQTVFGAWVGYWLWRRLTNGRSFLAFVLTSLVLLLCLKGIVTVAKGRPIVEVTSSWFLEQVIRQLRFVIDAFRADVLFGLEYAIFCTIVLRLTADRWYRSAKGGLACVSVVLLALAGLEFAHYLKTGVVGSGSLLLYFIRNLPQLISVISSEVDLESLTALLFPVLFASLFAVCVRFVLRADQRSTGSWQSNSEKVSLGPALWPMLVVAVAFPAATHEQHVRLFGNTVTTLVRDTWTALFRQRAEVLARDNASPDGTKSIRFEPTDATRKSNVVIIMLESIRASATSLHNNSLTNTPFLDELKERSIKVDSMYAVVPRTSAAWISVLQGIYPGTNTEIAWWSTLQAKDQTFTSLPKLLAAHGYQSAFFVPTHLAYENEGQILQNMGFDRIVSHNNLLPTNFEKVNYFGLDDRVMIEPIRLWLGEQERNRSPFLLTVMTNVGHHPYSTPSSWRSKTFGEWSADSEYGRYLNCIAYIDSFLKDLFGEFEKRGLFSNTIFIVLGDHGESFGEHGLRQHALSLYEDTLHVPMLIFAPHLAKDPESITGIRQQIDVLPTIGDLLGFKIAGTGLPGKSLLGRAEISRPAYYRSILDNVAMAMRIGSKKYIYHYDHQPVEVFNLEIDPEERRDISESVESAELASAENQMLSWQSAVSASLRLD